MPYLKKPKRFNGKNGHGYKSYKGIVNEKRAANWLKAVKGCSEVIKTEGQLDYKYKVDLIAIKDNKRYAVQVKAAKSPFSFENRKIFYKYCQENDLIPTILRVNEGFNHYWSVIGSDYTDINKKKEDK